MPWTLAPALRTLLAEVNALYPGRDKRTDGTISGYPGARSSHNYNSEGYVCALDITTGPYPGGISTAQGQALAEKVRLALKFQPRGIPAYPIHYMAPPYVPTPGPYIATAGTDWEWEPYGYPGSDPHTSHLHVSVDWDIYTGGAPSGLADYLTEMSWNLGGISGQGSGTTPIKKDWFDMATPAELRTIVREEVELLFQQGKHLAYRNPKDGPDAWALLTGTHRDAVKLVAEQAAQRGILDQLAKGQGSTIDYTRIDAGVTAALAAGIKIEGTITTGGPEA